MKFKTLDATEPTTILILPNDFKLACNTNGVYKGPTIWLLRQFMEKLASAVPKACTCCRPRKKRRQGEGTLKTYCEVINYLRSSFSTDDDKAEKDVQMSTSKQPQDMNSVEYSKSSWLMELKCGSVYDESMLKGQFNEGVHGPVRHTMGAYWETHKKATLQEFVLYTTSLQSPQVGSGSPGTTSSPKQVQGSPERRSDQSNHHVVVTDSWATNTMHNMPTNTDRGYDHE